MDSNTVSNEQINYLEKYYADRRQAIAYNLPPVSYYELDIYSKHSLITNKQSLLV